MKVLEDPSLLEFDGIKMVISNKNYWVCTLCKKQRLPLVCCLKMMPSSKTSNLNKHLNEVHKDELKAIKEKEKQVSF